MTRLKSQITNPKSQINSKIQITKTQKSLPSPGACLAKPLRRRQGRGWRGGGWFDKLTITTLSLSKGHPHPNPLHQGKGGNRLIPLFVDDVTIMKNLLTENEAGKHFSIQVSKKDQGRRLDQFLSETNLNLSRSQAKNLIEKHHILLNQKPTKPSAHIKTGDIISGTLPEPRPLSLNTRTHSSHNPL